MDTMTSILKTLIIVTLVALVIALANDNRRLQERNTRLEQNIRMVVMHKEKRCLGYVEPEDVIKKIYIEELTRR